jgi:hypothetical protein
MDKNIFIDLATNSSLADIISVLRTTKILNLIDQDHLLEELELLEEDPDSVITLLHSPYGDLEAHSNIPQSDIEDLQAEGCQVIQLG